MLSHLNILLNLSTTSFVIAFSGGLDSTVLLHQMMLWQKKNPFITFRALHVNHGLNFFANDWSNHCLSICNRWKIKCDILYINVTKKKKWNTSCL